MASIRTGSHAARAGSSSPPVFANRLSSAKIAIRSQPNLQGQKGIAFKPSAALVDGDDSQSSAKPKALFFSSPRDPLVTADSGMNRSPLPARAKKVVRAGSLSAPTTEPKDDADSKKVNPPDVAKASPRMSTKTSMMTSSTEDGFSAASSMNDLVQLQVDARLREQQERFESVLAEVQKSFAEREMLRDAAELVPSFSEKLSAMVDRAMDDALATQQQKLQLRGDQLRAELGQEIDILQATVAGLREEHSRLEHEIAKLSLRQSKTESDLGQVQQARSTLLVDMACSQAELARVRDWSEYAMRRSVTNVDELRVVVENLTDMVRKQHHAKGTLGGTQTDCARKLDQAVREKNQKMPDARNCDRHSGLSASSGRRLQRSWAPRPLELDDGHFTDLVKPVFGEHGILTPPALVVDPVPKLSQPACGLMKGGYAQAMEMSRA